MWLFIVVAVGIIILLVYIWYHLSIYRTKVRHIKTSKPLQGPSAWFLTGFNPFDYKPTQTHIRMKDYTKLYGDFYQIPMLFQNGVVVTDADVLLELMGNKNFTLRMYPPLFDRFLKNRGILFTNDMDHWKIQRNAALHGIMNNSHLKQIAAWANASTDKLISRLIQTNPSSKYDIDIDIDLSKLALDVIGQAAFSVDINSVVEDKSPFTPLIRNVMDTVKYIMIPPIFYNFYMPKGLKLGEHAILALRDMVRKILQKRKEENKVGEYNDLLDILLKYQLQEGEDVLSDESIVFTCWDMFIAGHETTAHTMAWALHHLAEEPEVQAKLLEEIKRELGDTPPDFDNIKKLNYLSHVIKETLRLRPVVPLFTRLSPSTEVLNGYVLPPMTAVFIVTYKLHVHPKYWDEPLRFNPDRWDKIENIESIPYRPFGYGHRACVGARMANIEAKVVLAKLIKAFAMYPPSVKCVIEEEHEVTMRPKGMMIAMEVRS